MNDSIKIPDCKLFNGYKPCSSGKNCLEECRNDFPFGKKILIISLEAMGAVIQSTAILKAIKRKYPVSTIYWITLKNAFHLLDFNPYIDKTFIWNFESVMILKEMEFDILFCVDKAVQACALANSIKATEKFGFGLNKNGAIIPFNKESEYSFRMGLDDNLKFRINQKTGQEILSRSLCLPYEKDEYVLELSDEEKRFCIEYKRKRNILDSDLVIGFNTGCSELFPNKKMTIEQHVELINRLSQIKNIKLVLIGGPEDTLRNKAISGLAGDKVINTPTEEGLRRGICYENICDVVITGDSFGMHLAIALKKYVIAWFGLSCWTEIDLYDKGVKLIPEGLECAPCWKKVCPKNLECIKMIDLDRMVEEVKNFVRRNK
jgi:ADP-heptose:LPS heptosyltransferase